MVGMKKKLTKGVSWQSDELLAAGMAKASSLGMSFSGYINSLVRKDLGIRGVFSQDSDKDLTDVQSKPSKGREKSKG